jgi:hypothetical protein
MKRGRARGDWPAISHILNKQTIVQNKTFSLARVSMTANSENVREKSKYCIEIYRYIRWQSLMRSFWGLSYSSYSVRVTPIGVTFYLLELPFFEKFMSVIC